MTGVGRTIDEGQRTSLDVWAVEPFFGGSHRHFLEGLAARSAHSVTPLTLPGRNWKWRMHGGAISLSEMARGLAERRAARREGPPGGDGLPDVLFASDMLDLPTFLAVAGPGLSRVPAMVYFHENQLTYPLPEGVERDLGYGMKNIASALAARVVLFNSDFHRREFLEAVTALLACMPDEVPEWVPARLEARCKVMPVGCDLRALDEACQQGAADSRSGRWGELARGPLIVWNQRWEYDKAPGELFAALMALRDRGVKFRLAVCGSGHGPEPDEFVRARLELGDRVVQWGRLEDRTDYASLLWSADVVASSAIHEFFGISVVEAIYCGCRPVLPWRLSYPEIVPSEAHEEVLYREGELVGALERAFTRPKAWSEDWQRTWVSRYDWAALAPRYDDEIRRCRKAAREE